ncbi:235_t:CDS:2 [Rhizophagus irregularis]|nr:235_t:CDS:2 [Rhizophagus irregularis]
MLEVENVKTKAGKADIENMYIELLEAIREEYVMLKELSLKPESKKIF